MSTMTTDFELSQSEFNQVRELVYEHCGISLNQEKQALVRARLAKQLRAGSYASVADYLGQVTADRKGPAFTKFIDAISTNLTSFFRENQHFDFLRATGLPGLFRQKQANGQHRLLGWSAACSSGEEPYSLAITLLEALREYDPKWACEMKLLATDISTAVLKTAQMGVYPSGRLSSVPGQYRSKYFETQAGAGTEDLCQPTKEVKQIVRFRHLNLMETWPFSGPFDFIFCRNVMIYFDKQTQQKLVGRFWNCLAPGGLLFTGHSESLTGIAHQFANLKPSIYQKCKS